MHELMIEMIISMLRKDCLVAEVRRIEKKFNNLLDTKRPDIYVKYKVKHAFKVAYLDVTFTSPCYFEQRYSAKQRKYKDKYGDNIMSIVFGKNCTIFPELYEHL